MHPESDFFIQLLPVLLLWIVIAPLAYRIARRKGIGTLKIIIGLFPVWAALAMLYWASLTDKDVLERLDSLDGRGHS